MAMESGVPSIDPMDLFLRFAGSPHGEILNKNARYDAKFMKPSWVSVEKWHQLLGDDVNNLQHLRHTIGIVDQYERYNEGESDIIPEEYPALKKIFSNKYDLLRTVAAMHDIQEVLNGDINYHDKNGKTEHDERFSFMMLSSFFYGDTLSYDARRELASIIFDRQSSLGSEFAIVEQLGYLQTALKAAETHEDQDLIDAVFPGISDAQKGELQFGMRRLVLNVLPYQIPKMIGQSDHSPAACKFLTDHFAALSQAMLLVPGSEKYYPTMKYLDEFGERHGLTLHYDRSLDTVPSLIHFA